MLKKTRHAVFTMGTEAKAPEVPAKPETAPPSASSPTQEAVSADSNEEAENAVMTAESETPEPETTEPELIESETTDPENNEPEPEPAEPVITGHWDLDPSHTRIGFSTRHAMISRIRGAFNEVSGWADIAEDVADSKATVIMQTGSVDTRNTGRDQHLCSEDFFDIEQFPEITFVSSAIDEVDENSYVVTGDLTIKDVTKSVSVPLELLGIDSDPFGNLRAGLEGSRRIDRRGWGMEWNTPLDSGGVLVGEKITLEFEMSLIKETRKAAEAEQD